MPAQQHRAEHHILAPDVRATTCAQARWNRLAALTPSARAWRAPAPTAIPRPARCASAIPLPSPCTSRSPNGASARRHRQARRGRTPRAPPAHAQTRLRDELRNGTGAGSSAHRPRMRLRSPRSTISSVDVVQYQVMVQQQHHPAAVGLGPAPPAAAAAAPAADPADSAADRSAPAAAPATSPSAGSSSISSTASGACRHTTCTGCDSLPTAPPCAGCRDDRSPPAAPAASSSSPPGSRTPSTVCSRYGSPSRAEQMMEQDPFLQRRQRIDVLDVGRTARHRLHDPARSPPAVSSTSGSISGVIASQPAGNPVRRHLNRLRAAHRRAASDDQRRTGKQHPARRAAGRLTHPLEQPHRQQRMAAQLEEVVVPADPLAGPAAPPDRRQRLSDLALRRLVAAPRIGIAAPAPAAPCGPACRSASAAARPAAHTPPAPCTPAAPTTDAPRKPIDARRLAPSSGQRVVGHQPLLPGCVLARQHHRLAHPGMRRQPRLDLAKLDAEAADLHL